MVGPVDHHPSSVISFSYFLHLLLNHKSDLAETLLEASGQH